MVSYDIYAIPAGAEQSAGEAAEAFFAAEEAADVGTASPGRPPDGERHELAAALRAADSSLDPSEERNSSGVLQCLSLYGPELEVNLYADHAVITWPYWDSLDADVLTQRLGLVLRTLRDRAGYLAWDPQLDAPLDPDGSLEQVRAGHRQGVETVSAFAARERAEADAQAERSSAAVEAPERPWWRRLF